HIFTQDEIEQAIKLAAQHGLVLTSKLDLSCDEKVVHWRDVGLDYTFVVFTLRKLASAAVRFPRTAARSMEKSWASCGRFLRFPLDDRRCNRTRASVGNAGGNARQALQTRL